MKVSLRLGRLCVASGLLALSAGAAAACAICFSTVDLSPGQELDNADLAVLAAAPDGGGAWRILARIKGDGPIDMAELGSDLPPGTAADGAEAELLIRSSLGYLWTSLGSFDPDEADWLTEFALSPVPEAAMTEEGVAAAWRERLGFVAPELEGGDPGIEAIAHGELARAPYSAIRQLGATFEAQDLLEWIMAESVPTRRAAYVLMLGATGDPGAAAWVEGRIAAARAEGDAGSLAALIAALLDLRGPARLPWVEASFLLDPAGDLAETDAVLAALDVHGNAEATIPRRLVVDTYRRLIRERPDMAGRVAMKLAEWEEWEATADYVALLNAGAIADPAEEYAAMVYVSLSTDEAAKARLTVTFE